MPSGQRFCLLESAYFPDDEFELVDGCWVHRPHDGGSPHDSLTGIAIDAKGDPLPVPSQLRGLTIPDSMVVLPGERNADDA
jgi:hypothetical protein